MSSYEITCSEWESLLRQTGVSKQQLNELVMEYLVIEGHRDAAAALARESGAIAPEALNTISSRVKIREAIMAADIPLALNLLREHTQILDQDDTLHMRILKQHVCDLISKKRWDDAFSYAQMYLAPLAKAKPETLEEFEQVMGLFAFPNPHTSCLGYLLSSEYRSNTADMLNRSLLRASGQSTVSKIPLLLESLIEEQTKLGKIYKFTEIPYDRFSTGGIREGSWEAADKRTALEFLGGMYRTVVPLIDPNSPSEQVSTSLRERLNSTKQSSHTGHTTSDKVPSNSLFQQFNAVATASNDQPSP